MSTKVFCDACGQEGARNKFSYPVHIRDMLNNMIGAKYVDNEGNGVSGRNETVDLCNNCQNRVYVAAVKTFRALQIPADAKPAVANSK